MRCELIAQSTHHQKIARLRVEDFEPALISSDGVLWAGKREIAAELDVAEHVVVGEAGPRPAEDRAYIPASHKLGPLDRNRTGFVIMRSDGVSENKLFYLVDRVARHSRCAGLNGWRAFRQSCLGRRRSCGPRLRSTASRINRHRRRQSMVVPVVPIGQGGQRHKADNHGDYQRMTI